MYCRNQRKSGTTRCVTRSRGPQSNKGPFNLFSKLSINVKLTIYIFFPFPRSYSLQRTLCHDWRATKTSLLSTITLLLLLAYNSARSWLRGNISGCYMGCLLLPREKYSNLKQLVGWQIVKRRKKKVIAGVTLGRWTTATQGGFKRGLSLCQSDLDWLRTYREHNRHIHATEVGRGRSAYPRVVSTFYYWGKQLCRCAAVGRLGSLHSRAGLQHCSTIGSIFVLAMVPLLWPQ